MSNLPPPSSDRPTRSIPEAIDELIASMDRLRSGWQQTRDKVTVDLQRSDRVLGHLKRAAEAARNDPPPKPASGQVKGSRGWHPCANCGKTTNRAGTNGLCGDCFEAQRAEGAGE